MNEARTKTSASDDAAEYEYTKLQELVADELTAMHGGNMKYVKWTEENQPWFHLWLTKQMAVEISRSTTVLPLPVFKALLDLLVAAHRYAYAQWQHRVALNTPQPTCDDTPYAQLRAAAVQQIAGINGGNLAYIHWLSGSVPWMHRWLVQHTAGLDRGGPTRDEVPFAVFESQVGVLVAVHRRAFVMWEHREVLDLLSLPVPPITM